MASAQLAGCALGLFFIDRFGRRPLLLLSLVGITLALGLEGATFALSCACDGRPWHCRVPTEDFDPPFANGTTAPPPPPLPPLAPPASPSAPFALESLCDATGWLSLAGMVLYLLL